MNKLLLSLVIGAVLTAASVTSANDKGSQEKGAGAVTPISQNMDRSQRPRSAVPASIEGLKMAAPLQIDGVGSTLRDSRAGAASGPQTVLITLMTPSIAEQDARGQSAVSAAQNLRNEQATVINAVTSLDPNARVIDQVQVVLNGILAEVDASALDAIANNPSVKKVTRVTDYEMDLSETVPYIGAAAVQAGGEDGSGVIVAVLDSGIDYNHAALGGSGNPADYASNDPNVANDPGCGGICTFPTAKVTFGADYVGSAWPGGALAPDRDPLDDGPASGHGTHVAHIIGGAGGVAPGVDLWAVKVCSSTSTSCSGVALLQGMEFAVDPNRDGDPSDGADIINMSLGSPYGQPYDDDLSQAVNNATRLGVLTVASAGNSGDKPWANGTPSAARTALSVAQTAVPSAFIPQFQALAPAPIAGIYNAVYQPWSAPPIPYIGSMQYADGAGGNLNGCAPFAPGSLTGLIVLVDRGACAFTAKIVNIGNAGGVIGIIGLVDDSAPFPGGGTPAPIPGYMISLADSNTLKSGLPETLLFFDPIFGVPAVGSIVSSSSRGPQHEGRVRIKPEIGAPGASVSAIAGTGTGEGPFGGTSGAAPMVAGSAALVLADRPFLRPHEVKALLMNTAETDIVNDPLIGELAPITRIGGGEVRVDRAVDSPAAAWDISDPLPPAQGGVSFGFVDASQLYTLKRRTVRVRNYSDTEIMYNITPTYRFANDDNNAVTLKMVRQLKVPAFGSATFNVWLKIRSDRLRGNHTNSGFEGNNPDALTLDEYDGYITLNDGANPIHLPWHVWPRQSADVVPDTQIIPPFFISDIGLYNQGWGIAQNEAFAWFGGNPFYGTFPPGFQAPLPNIKGVGIKTIPVPAGFCGPNDSFLWLFAIQSWKRQQHLMPVSYFIDLDIDQDGTPDFAVLNRDTSVNNLTGGQQLSWVLDYSTNGLSAFFYAEHAMNTANTTLIICGDQVGLDASDFFINQVDMDVYADDFYYGGPGDFFGPLTVSPWGEQYEAFTSDLFPIEYNPFGLEIFDWGQIPGNSPEMGVMMYSNADRGPGARGGAKERTETLYFYAPPPP